MAEEEEIGVFVRQFWLHNLAATYSTPVFCTQKYQLLCFYALTTLFVMEVS